MHSQHIVSLEKSKWKRQGPQEIDLADTVFVFNGRSVSGEMIAQLLGLTESSKDIPCQTSCQTPLPEPIGCRSSTGSGST
jgi:hypothetical protein